MNPAGSIVLTFVGSDGRPTGETKTLYPDRTERQAKRRAVSVETIARELCRGRYDYDTPDHYWPPVFEYLAEQIEALKPDKKAFHLVWTESGGHLRRKIKNDALLLQVLQKSLPGYSGEGMTVYRGECRFLYDDGLIGFCWTPKKEVAAMFAGGLNAIESGGVLLKAYAPPAAILAPPNDHSKFQMQEFEYTCNPQILSQMSVIETFPVSDHIAQ